MRAPVSSGLADMLLMRCGFPPEPDDRHTRHAVILDGLPFGSVVEAATYAGLTPQTLYMALHRGRDVRGHTIRYAKEER